MRPYLAVLKDSFHEALVSRVLWVILVLVTMFLVCLSPLGFKEIRSTTLQRVSVRDWPVLLSKIADRAKRDEPSPARIIQDRLSTPLKQRLAESAEQTPGELSSDIIDTAVFEFNSMINGAPLYDEAAWSSVSLNKEARNLIDSGAAQGIGPNSSRLNRLLIESAFPSEFPKGRKPSVETAVVYLWMQGDPLPFTPEQLDGVIRRQLQNIVYFGIGVFGVFAAILVTSSIIPQMFEPGSFDLLLSKPVSRIGLFLTKFSGGCIYIGMIAVYFISGLWLICGLRFGIWAGGLFLCLPIFLLLFAVYYSVSAFAAVIWRNAIVSVIFAVLFWGLCFGLWAAKVKYFEGGKIDPERFVKIVPAGNTIFGVNELGQCFEWASGEMKWQETFVGDGPPMKFFVWFVPRQLLGPMYDAPRERILAAEVVPQIPGLNLAPGGKELLVGKRTTGWSRKKTINVPIGIQALHTAPNGEIMALTKGALFRLSTEDSRRGNKDETIDRFIRIGPEPSLQLSPGAASAVHPDSGAVVIYNRGTVILLDRDAGGNYSRKIEKEVAAEKDSAVITFGGDSIVIALADGRVLLLNPSDLSVSREFRPFGDVSPRFATAARGGRWVSVLFHDRRVWLYDLKQNRPADFSLPEQGDLSALTFDGDNHLLIADRATRVMRYELEPFRRSTVYEPELTKEQTIYYYGLMPLYSILPKPGDLGNAIEYFVTNKSAVEVGINPTDLSDRRMQIDVSGPIWNSLACLGVLLAVSCCYVWRKDF